MHSLQMSGVADSTPEQSLARYRASGDPGAFGALFDATAPVLFRVALSLCPDAATAEDALQETFLAVLGDLDRFDPARPVLPWLLGILRHRVQRVRRTTARTPDRARLGGRAAAGPADRASEREDQDRRVRAAIDGLEEPYRSVALLRWRYGLQPAEIADVRGEPPGTTRSLLSRALDKLRRTLRTLPALLVGPRPPRGLGAVRETVVAKSAEAAVLGKVAAVAGGLLVGKKVAAVAAVVLLGLLGTWLLVGDVGSTRRTGDEPQDRVVASAPGESVAAPSAGPVLIGSEVVRDSQASGAVGPQATGRVVGADGRPVEGATVWSVPSTLGRPVRPGAADAAADPIGTVRTDGEGAFSVSLLGEAPHHVLRAESPAHGSATAWGVRPGDSVTLTLADPAALSGTVTDAEGNGVAGARIRLGVLDGAWTREVETVSGPDGGYRLVGLPPTGRVIVFGTPAPYACLSVQGPGFAPLFLEDLSRLTPGVEANLDLVLLRGASLTGRVVEAEEGGPIPEAEVVLWSVEGRPRLTLGEESVPNPWSPGVLGRARSREDGSFSFDHLPVKGPHASTSTVRGLKGELVGHMGAWKEGWGFATAEVALGEDGRSVETTIRLRRAATVVGRVIDEKGATVSGAWVFAAGEGRWSPEPPPSVKPPLDRSTTDGTGRYELAGVEVSGTAPERVTFEGRAGRTTGPTPEFLLGDSVTVEVTPGARAVADDLVLRSRLEHRSTAFLVTDERGQPVWGAAIGPGLFSPLARTDREGRATVTWTDPADLKAAEHVLLVSAPGRAPKSVVAAREAEEAEVQVMLGPAHLLSGRVTEADGRPASGAYVMVASGAVDPAVAFPEGSPGIRTGAVGGEVVHLGITAVDADGSFRLTDLPTGPWHVAAERVRWLEGRPVSRRVVLSGVAGDEGDLVLVLPPDQGSATGTVAGQVVDAETGRRVLRFDAVLVSGRESTPAAPAGPSRFRAEGVPVGRWTLRVEAEGYATATAGDVVVEDGEDLHLTVRLSRGTTVVGRLRAGSVSLDGRSVQFAPWSPQPGSERAFSAPLSADGSFRLPGLGPGRYRVWSPPVPPWDPNLPTLVPEGEEGLDVPPDAKEVRFDATLEAAGTLMVHCLDPRLPWPRVSGGTSTEEQKRFGEASRVVVLREDGRVVLEHRGVERGAGGAASYLPLPPGRYVLRLFFPGDAVFEKRVELRAGHVTQVDLPASR